jgi:hypothetical protein
MSRSKKYREGDEGIEFRVRVEGDFDPERVEAIASILFSIWQWEFEQNLDGSDSEGNEGEDDPSREKEPGP